MFLGEYVCVWYECDAALISTSVQQSVAVVVDEQAGDLNPCPSTRLNQFLFFWWWSQQIRVLSESAGRFHSGAKPVRRTGECASVTSDDSRRVPLCRNTALVDTTVGSNPIKEYR